MTGDGKQKTENTTHTRRGFLKRLLTVSAVGLPFVSGHDRRDEILIPLPEHEFRVPETVSVDFRPRYEEAFKQLETAIKESGKEVAWMSGQFGLLDLPNVSKGVDITFVPSNANSDPAFGVQLRGQPERYAMPATARVLQVCMDIERLNEQCPQPVAIEFDNVAAKLINHYQVASRSAVEDAPHMKNEISGILAKMVETSRQAVSDPPAIRSRSASLDRTLNTVLGDYTIPIEFTAKNPALQQHQQEGRRINTESRFASR
jgi:hypothetical protein